MNVFLLPNRIQQPTDCARFNPIGHALSSLHAESGDRGAC
jgi:hypothetical protein